MSQGNKNTASEPICTSFRKHYFFDYYRSIINYCKTPLDIRRLTRYKQDWYELALKFRTKFKECFVGHDIKIEILSS